MTTITNTKIDCLLCKADVADHNLKRIQVWEDNYWRLTVSLLSEIPGFSYLEPKRHIPSITDLNGEEAKTLGIILAKTTKILQSVTKAKLVYVYIFGDHVPHLHIHLAPHNDGDALNHQIIKGTLESIELENGTKASINKEFPLLPEKELRIISEHIKKQISI